MSAQNDKLLPGFEHLGKVRIYDLICKTAHVSKKDVIKVLTAAHIIGSQFDITLDEMIPEDYGFHITPPTSENVGACEQAYDLLKSWIKASPASSATKKGMALINKHW